MAEEARRAEEAKRAEQAKRADDARREEELRQAMERTRIAEARGRARLRFVAAGVAVLGIGVAVWWLRR